MIPPKSSKSCPVRVCGGLFLKEVKTFQEVFIGSQLPDFYPESLSAGPVAGRVSVHRLVISRFQILSPSSPVP